ncbi:hypothetical protein HYFRA_00012546 [Hymenoscyphus fraxineus]|uniref:Uncharacterized protein n=1 Tax=Hymenoscyphus fraxineus TaxID=746836 RepID=A0A9N9L4A0_9HELO|nr:hypothetical protein HYFRA_00012546 [Hymenoscyphus fraxineus]
MCEHGTQAPLALESIHQSWQKTGMLGTPDVGKSFNHLQPQIPMNKRSDELSLTIGCTQKSFNHWTRQYLRFSPSIREHASSLALMQESLEDTIDKLHPGRSRYVFNRLKLEHKRSANDTIENQVQARTVKEVHVFDPRSTGRCSKSGNTFKENKSQLFEAASSAPFHVPLPC